MDTVRLDVTYAVRAARRNPLFTAGVILTLAIAVGASAAVFAVVQAVLLRPLPIQDQDHVVVLRKEQRTGSETLFPFSVPEMRAFADAASTIEAVGGVQYDGAWPMALREGERLLTVRRAVVSGSFFGVLGVRPVAGRALTTEDDVVGGEVVAVISHAVWLREFGGDPAIVGRVLHAASGATTYAVVGVMPRGFDFPSRAEMWTPTLPEMPQAVTTRSFAPYSLVGRLRRGATLADARAELGTFLARQTDEPGKPRDVRAGVRPFESLVAGEVRPALLVLAAAALLLLALATANIANLFLVRGIERRSELAVRTAIGAGRNRLVRQLLLEGLMMGVLGGVGGILLASSLLRWLVGLAPAELPRLDEVTMDAATVTAAAAMAFASALVSSLLPVGLIARGGDLTRHLRAGGRGTTDRRAHRGGSVLVVTQVALAVVVLVGAGLLVRTLGRLQTLDMGFSTASLSTAALSFPAADSQSEAGRERLVSFYERMATRLEALAGVSAATLVSLPPFGGINGWDASFTVEGESAAEATENPSLDLQAVVPGHFRAMGIPIRRGRAITEADRAGAALVVVIGEALARRAWPGGDPLGRRLKLGTPDSTVPWRTVVGVVGDVRYRELTSPRPVVYVPWAQTQLPPLSLMVLRGPPGRAPSLADLTSAVREVEPAAFVTESSPMNRLIALTLARPRFNAAILATIALIALAIAAIGIYAVMAALVRQRRREMGIRIAVGAQPYHVRRLVLGRGLALSAAGVAAGLAIALPAARVLTTVLYDVSPADPLTIAGAAVLLVTVAVLACYLPARAAMRLDPVIVLRSD